MAREIAPTNQFTSKHRFGTEFDYRLCFVVDHPDFPGFVTFDDAGPPDAFLVSDQVHAGFMTPDAAATDDDADADPMIVGGTFAYIVPR